MLFMILGNLFAGHTPCLVIFKVNFLNSVYLGEKRLLDIDALLPPFVSFSSSYA